MSSGSGTRLDRAEFDRICKALIAFAASTGDVSSPAREATAGWEWHEHPTRLGFGYMARQVLRLSTEVYMQPIDIRMDSEDTCALEEDMITVGEPSLQRLSCIQYIVLAATFCVPTFYFSVSNLSGSPVQLSEILRSNIFKPHIWSSMEVNSFGLTAPNSSFPLLSMGDHPTLGMPSWFVHPCDTSKAVDELLSERIALSESDRSLQWFKAWFVVIGSVVNMSR